MFSRITKKSIKKKSFESDGLEIFSEEEENIYFRPRKGMKLPPSAEENFATLKIKLLELFQEHHKGNFAKLEVNCSISEPAMRKYLKGIRKITRELLQNFVSEQNYLSNRAKNFLLCKVTALNPILNFSMHLL